MTLARLLWCAASLASCLAGAGAGEAQTAMPPGAAPARVEVGVAAGLFLPTEESVGRVYDGPRVSWVVDADVRIRGRLSAFAGVRSVAMEGRANGFDPASGVVADTKLSARSVLVGARVHHRWERLSVFAGGGAAWTSYEESWPDLDAVFSGSAWGPVVQGGVVYRVWRRLGVIGRVDWFRAATGQGSLLDSDVDLGGVHLAGGVTFGF
jgi:hypothetical protein